MYIPKSIYREQGNPGIGIQPRDLLVLYNVNDILFMPQPDDKGVVIEQDIVLKKGCYGIEIYMTQGTAEITSAAEGDTDKIGFTPSVKFSHPGNSREVREFKVNEINSKFIAVVRYCSGKPADLIGTLCNPCRVTPSYTGNNDGNANEFTVQQISKGNDIFIYKGAIPLEEPSVVVESGASEIRYSGDGIYQTSAGVASIASISGGSQDAVITITGTSGEAPTLSSSERVLLKGGKTFTASEGSQITLRAVDAGEAGIIWVEQSRFVAN